MAYDCQVRWLRDGVFHAPRRNSRKHYAKGKENLGAPNFPWYFHHEMRFPGAISVRKFAVPLTLLLLLAVAILSAHGQFRRGRRGFRGGYESIRDQERLKEQEIMRKALNPGFSNDVFTFARVKFTPDNDYGGYGNGRPWDDDEPDADLNLIFRLHQVTSLKVQPGIHIIDITTEELSDYPFVYSASGGRFTVSDEEATALRNYLLNGGFLMVDDFWGDDQWHHFHDQMKRVFPDREPVELTIDHPIFHNVYPFTKEPQIPSVGAYGSTGQSYDPGWPYEEKNHDPHYYAIYDDKQRIMVLACHNNHYGDGWEHEGDDQDYFNRFSLRQAYPMFLNILVYAMEH